MLFKHSEYNGYLFRQLIQIFLWLVPEEEEEKKKNKIELTNKMFSKIEKL